MNTASWVVRFKTPIKTTGNITIFLVVGEVLMGLRSNKCVDCICFYVITHLKSLSLKAWIVNSHVFKLAVLFFPQYTETFLHSLVHYHQLSTSGTNLLSFCYSPTPDRKLFLYAPLCSEANCSLVSLLFGAKLVCRMFLPAFNFCNQHSWSVRPMRENQNKKVVGHKTKTMNWNKLLALYG